jgi:hypothetical protein
MTKPGGWKFIVFIFLTIPSVYAQKVKYKDIYALLSTKQYEQAEPFLKRYLKDNDDNPNALLFMGIIYQEKAAKADILRQTPVVLATMDSAISQLQKAFTAVDDREVRKNKEYYESYSRRDLRTGEFGIKLSDVQFDIEKRIEGLKERTAKLKMLKHYFVLADSMYKKSNALFKEIKTGFATENQFYLRSNAETVKKLTSLGNKFDSCTKAFDAYKASLSNFGKTSYNQIFNLTEISDFTKDGIERADFYQDELKVWNYKAFAEKGKTIIEKEIFPMREHLITYDIEINKLRDKLNVDSMSVRSDLTKLIDKLLFEQLKKFDAAPLPMEVFSLKTSDLEYQSVLIENRPLRDSADHFVRLKTLDKELKLLARVDSLASRLPDDVIDKRSADYDDFISNTYGNAIVLKSYVKTIKDFADRERKIKSDQREKVLKAMDWIVDGADSIPLSTQLTSARFKSLQTVNDKITIGVQILAPSKVNGYFYTVTPTRKPEIKITFPVDTAFNDLNILPATKAISYSDATGQLYFALVYSEVVHGTKHPATLAKIYRSDGLAWSMNYNLTFQPKEILFRQDTGEVTLKNETQLTVIDKNGKVLR